jgi:hypothetical protein
MSKPTSQRSMQDILDKLADMVASADIAAQTRDKDAAKLLQKALAEGCKIMRRLERRIDAIIEDAGRAAGLGATGVNVNLEAIARTSTELEVFRSRDALREFLNALGDVMQQRGLDTDVISAFKADVLDNYEEMKGQRLSFDDFRYAFTVMKGICCNGPDGGSGGTEEPLPGPSDGPEGNGWTFGKLGDVAKAAGQLANFARLILLLHGDPTHLSSPPHELPPVPPAITQPTKMLALLLLASGAGGLNAQGIKPMPARVRTPSYA